MTLLSVGVGNDTAELLFVRGIDDAGRARVMLGILVEGVQVTVRVDGEFQQTDMAVPASRVVESDPVIIGERVGESSRSRYRRRRADIILCMFGTDVEVAMSVLAGERVRCLLAGLRGGGISGNG